MSKIQNLDLENLSDSDVLEAFVFLNLPELEINKVSKFSSDLGRLVRWCQGIVSYHILIHPYTYRNENSQIAPGSEVHEFAEQMTFLINRFYKFKRFLTNLKITKIPLADYVFNLQHSRAAISTVDPLSQLNNFSSKELGFILSYLPFSTSYKFNMISNKFRNGFIESINLITFEIIKEIYFFKLQSYEKIYAKIPNIYENNIFSKYFLMLDDILNSKCDNYGNPFIPFLTKDHLNYIKNIKKDIPVVQSICKVLCTICDITPERYSTAKGEVKIQYLDKIKKLIINNKLQKLMRSVNKLYINEQKLKIISDEIQYFYNSEKLDNIKKLNLGLYQLLLWEIFVYEYLKNYNPFDFISSDRILREYEKEEIEVIKYFIELMNYLKYNLKIKYYFSDRIVPSFGFATMFNQLKKHMNDINMYSDNLFESSNQNYEKIAHIYFESKDLILINTKPALFERIIVEIVSVNDKSTNIIINNLTTSEFINNRNCGCGYNNNSASKNDTNNNNNDNSNRANHLGTIKEEHSNSLVQTRRKSFQQASVNNSFSNCSSTNRNFLLQQYESFNKVPNDVVIKSILFYLDINSLPIFALVSKKCCMCIKTHMFIRLQVLGREKKLIEGENCEIIEEIEQKRKDFFKEYELVQPEISNANKLLSQITKDDLSKLKFIYKKYNKKFEILISPFVLLLGKKAKNVIKPDGLKVVSYYLPAQELFKDKELENKVRNFELETIPSSTFSEVEKLLGQKEFNPDNINNYSTSQIHLINWVKGVVEFHRIIRKYSLSVYDYEILSDNEINFCIEMDTIDLLYYKLLRYAAKYCSKYEKKAKIMMSEMNMENIDN